MSSLTFRTALNSQGSIRTWKVTIPVSPGFNVPVKPHRMEPVNGPPTGFSPVVTEHNTPPRATGVVFVQVPKLAGEPDHAADLKLV